MFSILVDHQKTESTLYLANKRNIVIRLISLSHTIVESVRTIVGVLTC